jgi:hypothetical protein
MKPSELVGNDGPRLIACLGELPFQSVKPLSTIEEEGITTKLVTSSRGSYSLEHEVFMANTGEDQYRFEQLKAISTNENTMDAPQETDQ